MVEVRDSDEVGFSRKLIVAWGSDQFTRSQSMCASHSFTRHASGPLSGILKHGICPPPPPGR